MNKALHALVYVILAVAGVALFFEIKLFDKKELLTERNDQLIQSLIDVAGPVEEANAPKPTSQPEARKDVSPIEAKTIETPDTENVLDEYHSELEAGNNKTLQWDGKRAQLRVLYQLDGEGIRYEIVAFARAVENGRGNFYISEDTSEAITKVIEDFNSREYILF